MLGNHDLMAFVATAESDAARDFYGRVLGLRFVEDSPFALVFDAHGIMLRIQKVKELKPTSYTALGWRVPDLQTAVQALAGRGVQFMKSVGVPQDDLGIWTTPDGTKVAWFKDPSGNILSLTQFAPQ